MSAAAAESAPQRKVTLVHRLVYAAVRITAGTLGALPFPLASLLARGLATLYALGDRRHLLLAQKHLQERLGLEPAAARRMAFASFRHVFLSVVETLHLERQIARRGLEAVITLADMDRFEKLYAEGKGVVVALGHIGNWEIVAPVAAQRGWNITTVYRRMDNPLLDAWMLRTRSRRGLEMVLKQGAIKPLLRALRGGRIAVLLVDQDAGRHGVFAPFFGKLASTIPTPAELALRTGAAIIVIVPARTGPGFRHVLRFMPPVDTHATDDHAADVVRITAEINAQLESGIRRAPEQWLWAHRRWKKQPKAEAAKGET